VPNSGEMTTVRLGMIGCGGIARHHMNQLREVPEAQIVALADPSDEQIARCKRDFPALADVPVFADYREMLDKVECDAVEISTPHTQHTQQVLDSFAKGLHVMCEKPLATTTADCRKLVAAMNETGKVGLLAYQRHYVPMYQVIRDRIASGAYGEVNFFSAVLGQAWKRGTAGSWRQDPALSGGGQINDSGSHVVDMMLYTTGVLPAEVTAYQDNRETPVDIDSAVSIKFENGALGNISVLGDFPAWHEDFTIGCTRGGFLVRYGELTIVENDGSKYVAKDLRGGSNPDRNFINAILGREPVLSTFEAALEVIHFTEAVWRSAELGGKPVRLADI